MQRMHATAGVPHDSVKPRRLLASIAWKVCSGDRTFGRGRGVDIFTAPYGLDRPDSPRTPSPDPPPIARAFEIVRSTEGHDNDYSEPPPLRVVELDGLADRALTRATAGMRAGDRERALIWLQHHRALRDVEQRRSDEVLAELEDDLQTGGRA